MKKFKDYAQKQRMLLPPSLEELIGEKELVRVVDRVMEGMRADSIMKRFSGGGKPAYHPIMMLKVLVYAYSRGIYSSRQIAKAIRQDIGFMWLSGMQRPDFRTVNRFRGEYFKESLSAVFSEVVLLLIKQGYIKSEDYFVDGTTIEANAGKNSYVWHKNVKRYKEQVEKRARDVLSDIAKLNELEDQEYGDKDLPEFGEDSKITSEKLKKVSEAIDKKLRDKAKPAPKKLAREAKKLNELGARLEKYETQEKILDGRNSYSKTDTDASFTRLKNKELKAAYNLQVGSENGFVVGYSAHQKNNDATAFKGHLAARKAQGLPDPKHIMGDSIYGTAENYTALKRLKIKNFLKYPNYLRDILDRADKFDVSRFTKMADKDAYLCPQSKALPLFEEITEKSKSGFKSHLKIYQCRNCSRCKFRSLCCKGDSNRSIRVNNSLNKFRAQARNNLSSEKGLELRKRRGNEIESVFGHLKHNRKFRRFSLRGLDKVSAESALILTSFNLTKIALQQ
jgi:transposase